MNLHRIRVGRAAAAVLLVGAVLTPVVYATRTDTTRSPLQQTRTIAGTATPAPADWLPKHPLLTSLEDLAHEAVNNVPASQVHEAYNNLAGLWTASESEAPHVDDVDAQFPLIKATKPDPDGCDAHQAIILGYATAPRWERGTCRIIGGTWWSRYDQTVVTDVNELTVDHLVPLKEAWRSGAWKWRPELRAEFVADTSGQLVPVTRTAHAAKAEKTITEWQPYDAEHCRYAVDWIGVKTLYRMTVDLHERAALIRLLRTCKTR